MLKIQFLKNNLNILLINIMKLNGLFNEMKLNRRKKIYKKILLIIQKTFRSNCLKKFIKFFKLKIKIKLA